jgi:ribonuclease VapC
MVIDSSAILAVLLNEKNATGIAWTIEAGSQRLLSAANLLETSIVIEGRKGDAGGRELDLLLYRAAIEIVAVDRDQAEIARVAWRRFGKGRHPAGLNYGDCFAYALAKRSGLPLLFQGDDFSRTDIEPVPLSSRSP